MPYIFFLLQVPTFWEFYGWLDLKDNKGSLIGDTCFIALSTSIKAVPTFVSVNLKGGIQTALPRNQDSIFDKTHESNISCMVHQ